MAREFTFKRGPDLPSGASSVWVRVKLSEESVSHGEAIRYTIARVRRWAREHGGTGKLFRLSSGYSMDEGVEEYRYYYAYERDAD